MRRTLSLVSLLALLAALAGTAQAGPARSAAGLPAAQPPVTALVYVSIASDQDVARFGTTGLPAYTSPWVGAPYVLTGADAAGQNALNAAGLSFRILDPDMAGGTYYYAYLMPGRPAPDWPDYGRLLLVEEERVLLRMAAADAERLVQAGVELLLVSLTAKPLQPPSPEQVFPTAVTPDPLIQSMMDQVVSAQVSEYDRQLAGELPVWVDGAWYTITTRHTYSGIPIQKTTSWIGQQWQALGLNVEYHQWGGATYPNVIGERPGQGHPDDIFIIGGHVDDVTGTPGADDNASAAVATMIAANIMTEYQWDCTLRFAVWTGEEQGLLGSEAYAQRAYQRGENIVGYLNLDMIAWNTIGSPPGIDLLYNPTMPPTLQLAQLEADVIDAYDIDLIPEFVTGLGGGSDHSSFWDYGYTAILSIEDQGDFNPYYHGPQDTPAHTDLGYFTNFVKASIGTFAHMSGCLIPSGVGALDGHVTAAGSGAPIGGAALAMEDQNGYHFYTSTSPSGYYTRTLLPGTYVVTASHPQYETATITGVPIVTDTVTTRDFQLTPRGRLWGYVTDLDNGFGLAATIASDDGLTAQTDPDNGYYELYLDQGTHLVTASSPNYAPGSATVVLVSGQSTRQDFRLAADISFVPKPVHVTMLLNSTGTSPAHITNRKNSPYPFVLYEIPGGFIPGPNAAWPGPDGFGYTGEEVDYDWVDIRTSGTPITGLSDDSYAGPFNIGFPFPFYGSDRTQFYVSSNGFISFGSGSGEWTNQCPLPNSAAPNNLVALMWDDLYPNYSTGGLYYQSFPTCPLSGGSCVVVEYYNWAHCCDPDNIAGTFEAILFDNGSVQVQYLDTGSELGSGSTEGIEGNNAPSNHGLTYACNAASSLPDGLSICYIHPDSAGCTAADVPWVGESPLQGTVPAGGSLDVTLYFSATAGAGVTQPGDYYATLFVKGTPKVRVPVTMTVVTEMVAPTASFDSSSPACDGTAVVFTDTSDLGVPRATDFLWSFGDGITATVENPTHLYAGPGSYTATLEVCNQAGCDTATGAVEVLAAPAAAFTFTTALLTVTFSNESANATAYLWAFGDGATSTATNPVHTYGASGSYTVTLTAYGCGENEAQAVVTVVQPPEAGFTSNTPVCLGEPALFTNTTVGADTYLWTFGDGETSTETNPTHLYVAANTYSVTLEACNQAGCDTANGTVEVRPLPEAGFTFVADLLTVTFTNGSQNATAYLWAFGDGSTSTVTNPVHTYAVPGSYTVTLWATGDCGTAQFTASLTVSQLPVAGFLSNGPVCLGEPAVFTNTSTHAESFLWTFGDGATSTETHPLHLYAAADLYTVTLEACNQAGCDTAFGNVEVLPLPQAGFTFMVDLLTATFTNTSQNATSYLWAFGDGITDTVANPVHAYTAAGTYTVTLSATGICGDATATQTVTVSSPAEWKIYLPLVVK